MKKYEWKVFSHDTPGQWSILIRPLRIIMLCWKVRRNVPRLREVTFLHQLFTLNDFLTVDNYYFSTVANKPLQLHSDLILFKLPFNYQHFSSIFPNFEKQSLLISPTKEPSSLNRSILMNSKRIDSECLSSSQFYLSQDPILSEKPLSLDEPPPPKEPSSLSRQSVARSDANPTRLPQIKNPTRLPQIKTPQDCHKLRTPHQL